MARWLGSRWPRRLATVGGVVAASVGLLVVPVAVAERSSRSAAGGNGVRHFYDFDGYADSTAGCDDFAGNPNVKVGRDHTSTIIGNMWLDKAGKLRTDTDGVGKLSSDGSFFVDFPKVGPASLRRIEGKIGPPNPDGLDAPVTGEWTSPYPNGTSSCLVHFAIIKGRINLEGGFGIPFDPKPSKEDTKFPIVPIGAVLLAGAGAGVLLMAKKPWKPRCRCSCSAKIVGDQELGMGDPATTWVLEPSQGGKYALDTWLVGSEPDAPLEDGSPRSPKKLRRLYKVELSEKCTGGGRVSYWAAQWKLGEATADHVDLHVTVEAGISCADGTTATITCKGSIRIKVVARCGPDLTDQYTAALNRVIDRIRARNKRLKELGIDVEDIGIGTAIGATLSAIGSKVGLTDWDEAEHGPLHIGEFLVANGPWITFRPYSQAYKRKGGEPPYWEPGECPSCLRCGATITFLGLCIDSYITDAFMYGVACGVLGVDRGAMVSGGLFAKRLNDHLNAETFKGAVPAWAIGFEQGTHAREHPDYRVGAVDLWLVRLVKFVPRRTECKQCSKKVEINGVDWASLDWSTANLLKGHGEKAQYPSPPSSTTTPFPKQKKLVKVPRPKKP